jgi:formylglycine-generating enzyme
MTNAHLQFVMPMIIATGITSCGRDQSSRIPADAVDDNGGGMVNVSLPGSLPGWERTFDGIQCKHPPVHAHCIDDWCRIPPGCYIKGSPEDEIGHPAKIENQRAVTLTHGLWIQQYEITQVQWTAMKLHNPSRLFPDGLGGDCLDDAKCPVGSVTWFEAVAFANLLSQSHDPPLVACYELVDCIGEVGHGMTCASVALNAANLYECEGYRLPTDAEYEYALRASTTEAFYTGPITANTPSGKQSCDPWSPLTDISWYCANSGRFTQAVGQKYPNAWHLYDMIGNAREWVHDLEKGQAPPPGPLTDPGGDLVIYKDRKTRGGSATVWPTLLRSASSLSAPWDFSFPQHGFRLVRTILNDTSNEKP